MFKLKGTGLSLDLTKFIPFPKYKINLIENYEEWIDSNKTRHRRLTDTKVEGEFTLNFHKPSDYFDFVSFYQANKDSVTGAIQAEVFCVNTNTTKTVYGFLDFEPQNELPLMMKGDGFTVTFEERGT